MKTLNRGTVVNTRSLVMKAAHAQAKAWVNTNCICFDSYSQALSYALKKAWAAVKGNVLVFSWEPEEVAVVPEVLALMDLKAPVVATTPFTVTTVMECGDSKQSTREQFVGFQQMLKGKGLDHRKANIGFVINTEGKPFTDEELLGLGNSPLIVAYPGNYGSFFITTYFYAKGL